MTHIDGPSKSNMGCNVSIVKMARGQTLGGKGDYFKQMHHIGPELQLHILKIINIKLQIN